MMVSILNQTKKGNAHTKKLQIFKDTKKKETRVSRIHKETNDNHNAKIDSFVKKKIHQKYSFSGHTCVECFYVASSILSTN